MKHGKMAEKNSTYYDIKVLNMENAPKFRPNPNLKFGNNGNNGSINLPFPRF